MIRTINDNDYIQVECHEERNVGHYKIKEILPKTSRLCFNAKQIKVVNIKHASDFVITDVMDKFIIMYGYNRNKYILDVVKMNELSPVILFKSRHGKSIYGNKYFELNLVSKELYPYGNL